MSLSTVIAATIITAALGTGIAALLLLCATAFPGLVQRARGNVETMPIRSFLIGLINFLFFGLIAAALLSGRELVQLFGLVALTVLLSLVATGLAAVAALLGARLLPGSGAVRQLLAGALVLEVATLVPLVGWITVPLLAGITGYGALIVALIRRRRTEAEQAIRMTGTTRE